MTLDTLIQATGPAGALVVLVFIGWQIMQQQRARSNGHPMSDEERATLRTILKKINEAKIEMHGHLDSAIHRLEKRLEDGQELARSDREYIRQRLDEHIDHHNQM